MAKKSKFTNIKAEIKNLPKSKQEIAQKLLEKAMFMDDQLTELQEILKEKGWVEEYKNGAEQYGLKKSSEGDVYNSLMKNYVSVIKQLNDILPGKSESGDALMSFLGGDTK